MDNNTTVTIFLVEYVGLRYNDSVLDFLIQAMRNAARLDYSGKELRFCDEDLANAIKLLLPDTYDEILSKLKADKEMDKEF